jgi:ADP-heptose:LPS heptosyltransferase
MDLRSKRKLDTLVGRPLLFALGLAGKMLGAVLRRDHSAMPARTIIVAKFQGVGSLAMAIPSLLALKRALPGTRFIFWGTPSTCGFARMFRLWDEVLVLDDRTLRSAATTFLKSVWAAWRAKADWAFDLEVYSKLSSVLLTLSSARNRAGFATDSVALRSNVHTHLLFFNRYRYVGESYRRLLELAVPNLEPRPPGPEDWVTPVVPHAPLARKTYIVLNPNVGELAPERAWSLESMGELVRRLEEAYPELPVVLVGKGAEESRRSAQVARAGSRVIDATDRLSLQELLNVLAHAKVVVSGDTGVLHLAALVNPSLVALFGPTLSQTYFPPERADTSRIVSKSLFCRPCVHHWPQAPCGGRNLCMQKISPSDVFQAVRGILHSIPEKKDPGENRVQDGALEPEYVPGLIYRSPV